MINKIIPFLTLGSILFYSCTADEKNPNVSKITEFTDADYPDNNDIEGRSDLWNKYHHNKVEVIRNDTKDFDMIFYPADEQSDTIYLKGLNLLAWMPTIPDHVTDNYLKHIGIINAEWNRNQVKLTDGEFQLSKFNEEHKNTVRVDLARNCLNAYAWEIITFTEEEGKVKSMYHGWFDFPKPLYRELFNEVNNGKVTFAEYKDYLEKYTHPDRKQINLSLLRDIEKEYEVPFTNLNHLGYPKTGARKSKYKNIVSPKNAEVINDLLNNETKFSTFQWPGYYDTSDPRETTLGKIANPKEVVVRYTQSKNKSKDKVYEFDITFASDSDTTELTRIVIGGIKESDLKKMPIEEYNNAFKYPMGIGNHPFYETLSHAYAHPTSNSPYYGFIIDGEGEWLDSHFFGVDGPIIHLDESVDNLVHFWMLSFERHAMVTHLTFPLKPVDITANQKIAMISMEK